jgi:hypothetical protein
MASVRVLGVRLRMNGVLWFRGGWRAGLLLLVATCFGLSAPAVFADTLTTTTSPLPGSSFQGADGNQDNVPPVGTPTRIDWQSLQADPRLVHTSDPKRGRQYLWTYR